MSKPQSLVVEQATAEDLSWLATHDTHVGRSTLSQKVARGEIMVARQDSRTVGWLRYGMFWDTIPFMNMLFVLEPARGKGIGKELVAHWEDKMSRQGYKRVMTSTLSNESAQHFYRKIGYADSGCLLLPGEPLEIFFHKVLD